MANLKDNLIETAQNFGQFAEDWNNDVANHGIMAGVPYLGAFYDDVTGRNAQQREFDEQEKLLHEEQDWASESARMSRLKAAGVNPLTAAAGVAGSGSSPSAPAVSNATGAPAAGLSSITGTADAVTSGIGNLAKAKLDESNANEVALNASVHRDYESMLTAMALEDIGVARETARSLTITNKWLDAEKSQDMLIKMQQFSNMQSDWQLLQDEHEKNLKALEWYDAEKTANIALMDAKALEASRNAEKIKIDKEYQQKINDFFDKYGFDPRDPDDVALRNLFLHNPDLYYKALETLTDKAYQFSYSQALGAYHADEDTAFTRFKNQIEGSEFGRRQNAKFFADLENYKSLFSELAKMYFSAPSSEWGLIGKIFNIAAQEFNIPEEDFKRMFEDAYRPR